MDGFKSYKQMAKHYISMCKYLRHQVEYYEHTNRALNDINQTLNALCKYQKEQIADDEKLMEMYELMLGALENKTTQYDELRVD